MNCWKISRMFQKCFSFLFASAKLSLFSFVEILLSSCLLYLTSSGVKSRMCSEICRISFLLWSFPSFLFSLCQWLAFFLVFFANILWQFFGSGKAICDWHENSLFTAWRIVGPTQILNLFSRIRQHCTQHAPSSMFSYFWLCSMPWLLGPTVSCLESQQTRALITAEAALPCHHHIWHRSCWWRLVLASAFKGLPHHRYFSPLTLGSGHPQPISRLPLLFLSPFFLDMVELMFS